MWQKKCHGSHFGLLGNQHGMKQPSASNAVCETSSRSDPVEKVAKPMNNSGQREPVGPDASLQSIFRRYRGPMTLTYSLFILENLIRLAQPLVIGLAVSDLM